MDFPVQYIDVDITPSLTEQPAVIRCSQSDNERAVCVQLKSNGANWTPESDMTADMVAKKKDGNIVEQTNITLNNDGTAWFSISTQMAAVPGKVMCELRLKQNYSVIGTANFILMVEGGVLDGTPSASSLDILTQIEEVAEAAETAAAQIHDISTSVDAAAASATAAAGSATQAASSATAAAASAQTASDAIEQLAGGETYNALRKRSNADYDFAWMREPGISVTRNNTFTEQFNPTNLPNLWDSIAVTAKTLAIDHHTFSIMLLIDLAGTNINISKQQVYYSLEPSNWQDKCILRGNILTSTNSDSASTDWPTAIPCNISYDDGAQIYNARALFLIAGSSTMSGQIIRRAFVVVPLDDISWSGSHDATIIVSGTFMTLGGNSIKYVEV